jgi:septum site-determining protein MinC
MNVNTLQITEPAFKLKGSVVTLSVLQLLTQDYAALTQQLTATVQKNPNFFNHMPVILDLQKLFALDNDINFLEINSLLRKNGLVPVGITNGNAKQIIAAKEAGMGILPNVKTTPSSKNTQKREQSKLITQPIRSGQQVYAKHSDLIVLASVSNGAEILADGNIHVYGTLRGRAIAGAGGEQNARIFCQKLEAELIAIAGYYKLQEELITLNHLTGVQVVLEHEQLTITAI